MECEQGQVLTQRMFGCRSGKFVGRVNGRVASRSGEMLWMFRKVVLSMVTKWN
jgi:hypothetical protein